MTGTELLRIFGYNLETTDEAKASFDGAIDDVTVGANTPEEWLRLGTLLAALPSEYLALYAACAILKLASTNTDG